MNNIGRIICDGKTLLWSGYCITIDRDDSFARQKSLPLVARVTSFGGRQFDVYMGEARSLLGNLHQFAVAVESLTACTHSA